MKAIPMIAAAEETLGAIVAMGIIVWFAMQAYQRWAATSQSATEPRNASEADGPDQPLCLRCLTPYEPTAYFCPHCNAAVGPYNNWMPYLHIYSEGQWLRSAATPPERSKWLLWTGYGLLSIVLTGPFAPLVWLGWWMVRRSAAPSPLAHT